MTRSRRSRGTANLPMATPMRSPILVALTLVSLAGVGCRRSGPCPPGQEETPAPTGDAFWCRPPGGKPTQYVQLHPGTRQWRQRCPFQDGVLEGPFTSTHPNGQRWVEGRYERGQLAGQWTQWNATGQKVAGGEYRDGRLVSGAPVAVAAVCDSIPRLQ
jgi:hypothetical protein